eukprot:403348168
MSSKSQKQFEQSISIIYNETSHDYQGVCVNAQTDKKLIQPKKEETQIFRSGIPAQSTQIKIREKQIHKIVKTFKYGIQRNRKSKIILRVSPESKKIIKNSAGQLDQ